MAARTFCGSSEGATEARSSILLASGALVLPSGPSASRGHPRFHQLYRPPPELLGHGVLVGEALVREGDRVSHAYRELPLVPLVEAATAGRCVASSPLGEELEPPLPRRMNRDELDLAHPREDLDLRVRPDPVDDDDLFLHRLQRAEADLRDGARPVHLAELEHHIRCVLLVGLQASPADLLPYDVPHHDSLEPARLERLRGRRLARARHPCDRYYQHLRCRSPALCRL